MKINDKGRDDINNMILQYDINREAAKISALSSSKIDIHMNILYMKKYYPRIKEE